LDWLKFLEWEEMRRTKFDWYLAQLTSAVVQPNLKKGKHATIKDFLIVYEEEVKRAQKSKASWLSLVGIDPKKN